MDMTNWHKSARSGNQGNCVEVGASVDGRFVGVRDTKNPGPTVVFSARAWHAFLCAIKTTLT